MSFAIAGPSKWQDDASEVSDPSDWLKGPFAFMRDLDASLRCEICSVSGRSYEHYPRESLFG